MAMSSNAKVLDMKLSVRKKLGSLLDVEKPNVPDSRDLAEKLGMTPTEIKVLWFGKGAGKHVSPTEDVLSWWEVRKDATVGKLYQILEDLGHGNACEILDNHYNPPMEVVDGQDEKPDGRRPMEQEGAESSGPKSTAVKPVPKVFLSYKRNIQDKVLELKERLEKNGITCWMDKILVEGGDNWKREIYKGLRGCKLVVSCLTKAYAQSETCQEEVALAGVLKKPILPLLFEQDAWPVKGPMAMPFAALTYVNCVDGLSNNTLEKILPSIKGKIQ